MEGREDVEDDPKFALPQLTNIEKVRQLVRSDRRLTIRVIANEVGMDKETVRTILVDINCKLHRNHYFAKTTQKQVAFSQKQFC